VIRVLFVCLGNICRSPMAEAIFIHKVRLAEMADAIYVARFLISFCVVQKIDPRRRNDAANGILQRFVRVCLRCIEHLPGSYVVKTNCSGCNVLARLCMSYCGR
jgi:hypothetical protein